MYLRYLTKFLTTADDKTQNGEEAADVEHLANEEEEQQQEEAAGNSCYYDKSKSFFDNLSCDDLKYVKMSTSFFICTHNNNNNADAVAH